MDQNQMILQLLSQYGLMDKNQLSMLGKDSGAMKTLMGWLFNPQFGALTDTYDPMLNAPKPQYQTTPEIGMPTAYGYSQAQGTLGDITRQLLMDDPTQRITPDGAQRLLQKAVNDPNSDVHGMDMAYLTGQLNNIIGDINSYQQTHAKEQFDAQQAKTSGGSDIFTKAGLPSLTEQYAAETAPMTQDMSDQLKKILTAQQLNKAKSDSLGLQQQADGSWDNPNKPMSEFTVRAVPSRKGGPKEMMTPRSESEARNFARRAGVNEDWVVEQYNKAVKEAKQAVWDKYHPYTDSPEKNKEVNRKWDAIDKGAIEREINAMIPTMYRKGLEWWANKPTTTAFDLGHVERSRAQRLLNPAPAQPEDIVYRQAEPSWQKRKDEFDINQKMIERMQAVAKGQAAGNAIGLTLGGHTPLKDALYQRLLAANQQGLIGQP